MAQVCKKKTQLSHLISLKPCDDAMELTKRLVAESGRILKIGIPITITQLLNVSMSFVDTVMTGNYSAEALAAVSVSHNSVMPLMLFVIATIGVAQAITAQYIGSGRAEKDIGNVTFHAILIGLCFSFLLIIYTKVIPLFLPFFGMKEPVISLACDYLFAFSWGIPGTIIFVAFAGFFAGISRPMMTLYISLLMVAVNVVGNYTLIFGHFGFPELGSEGAGWTSSFAAWSGALGIILISVLHRPTRPFNPFTRFSRLNRLLIGQILKIGIPNGFSSVFEVSMFAVFSLLMGRFGVDILAGSQIALNCASIVFMIPLGFSFAITTNVGLFVGQEKYREARLVGYSGYVVNLSVNFCSALLLIFFSSEIAGIYTNDAVVQAIAANLLLFAGVFQLSDGAQVAGVGILRGYKDTRIPMISNLISYWGVGMTLGYFLGFNLGYQAQGMWFGIIIGLTTAAVLHALRFKIVSTRFIETGSHLD